MGQCLLKMRGSSVDSRPPRNKSSEYQITQVCWYYIYVCVSLSLSKWYECLILFMAISAGTMLDELMQSVSLSQWYHMSNGLRVWFESLTEEFANPHIHPKKMYKILRVWYVPICSASLVTPRISNTPLQIEIRDHLALQLPILLHSPDMRMLRAAALEPGAESAESSWPPESGLDPQTMGGWNSNIGLIHPAGKKTC